MFCSLYFFILVEIILIVQNFTDCTLGKTILGNVKELNIYDDDNHHCLKIEKKN